MFFKNPMAMLSGKWRKRPHKSKIRKLILTCLRSEGTIKSHG